MPKDKNSSRKKYIAIVKIRNNEDGSAFCVKYRFNDLLNFTQFLDNKWPGWKWYNVYANTGKSQGIQLESFTKYRRPKRKYI